MHHVLKNLLLTVSLLAGAVGVFAQGTAFTYQGRVTEGGVPVSGQWDIVFSLHDAASGGGQIGLALTNPAVPVSLGLFTVTLDFGAQFPGADRWLEMAVRTNGTGPFMTLSPRQPITPAPYAITAGRVSGPISITQLPATLVTNGATGVNLSGTFTGSGAGLSNLPAASLPAGVTLVSADPQDAALLGVGLQRFMSVPAPAWVSGSTLNAPLARSEHSAIWTGRELLVWGGNVGSGVTVGTGSDYGADADQWNAISTIGAPSARKRHSAVWTGWEMIVWGGSSSGAYVGTGSRYNPTNLLWTPIATLNAPAGRSEHVAVWTGTRLVVWGGRDGGGLFNSGAIYNPASDAWTTLALSSTPDARQNAAAVWAGDRLLLWGGTGDSGELATGAHLLFVGATNATQWLPISTVNAPSARSGHSAIWTGSRLLIWGGRNAGTPLGDGGIYDPANDAWQSIPAATNSPSARSGHVAVWTGSEMIIWSGETLGGASATGSAYNPATGQWRTLTAAGGAVARTEGTAAWTGTELIVFGGRNGGSLVGSLQRLNPQPAWHFFRKP